MLVISTLWNTDRFVTVTVKVTFPPGSTTEPVSGVLVTEISGSLS